MGLAGQKDKQRISADPNNLFWSKDESKFGFRMLQKMGWAPGKGLGVNEDGHKEHVKIRLKDNNLGVGATKKNIDNWLGNTDAFSRLLADLNSQSNSEASSMNGDESIESKDKSETTNVEHSEDGEDTKKSKKSKDKKKKSSKKDKKEKKKESSSHSSKKDKKDKSSKKRSREQADDDEDKESKKSKKDKKDKKSKKSKKDKDNVSTSSSSTPAPVVLRNAARAKFLRAKKMASAAGDKSLNEILGIKSTTTKSTPGYQTIETSEATFMASFSV